jgi:hypothetical protein
MTRGSKHNHKCLLYKYRMDAVDDIFSLPVLPVYIFTESSERCPSCLQALYLSVATLRSFHFSFSFLNTTTFRRLAVSDTRQPSRRRPTIAFELNLSRPSRTRTG